MVEDEQTLPAIGICGLGLFSISDKRPKMTRTPLMDPEPHSMARHMRVCICSIFRTRYRVLPPARDQRERKPSNGTQKQAPQITQGGSTVAEAVVLGAMKQFLVRLHSCQRLWKSWLVRFFESRLALMQKPLKVHFDLGVSDLIS